VALDWHTADEATEWAIRHGRAECSLPTGTGRALFTTVWLQKCFDRGITHALVLEPNQLLVRQMTSYLSNRCGIQAVHIDGHLAKERRRQLWAERLVVCTPSIASEDKEYVRAQAAVFEPGPDDSCWFAFFELREMCRFGYVLLLTEMLPHRMRVKVEFSDGTIRYWRMPGRMQHLWWPGAVEYARRARLHELGEELNRELQWLRIAPFLPMVGGDDTDSGDNGCPFSLN
jgi:hypothetical protein